MAETKKSLNPIPSTLRGKKRYVKFRLLCDKSLAEKDVWFAISGSLGRIFGVSGLAQQRLWLVKWNQKSNEGIIRCALSEEDNAKAGLLFLQKVGSESVVPLVLQVSGSVAKLKG